MTAEQEWQSLSCSRVKQFRDTQLRYRSLCEFATGRDSESFPFEAAQPAPDETGIQLLLVKGGFGLPFYGLGLR